MNVLREKSFKALMSGFAGVAVAVAVAVAVVARPAVGPPSLIGSRISRKLSS